MKICIDAGHNHSGWDTGASYGGYKEQDITYDIAKKVVAELCAYDVETIETRPIQTVNLGMDLNSSLNERCSIANKNNADLFFSIHCNAYTDLSARGTESYIYKLGGKAEKLANSINGSLCAQVGLSNRGIKEKNLAVLRNTNMPAVLIETAFLSNPEDRSLLVNHQNEIALGIVKGIVGYLGISKINELRTINDIVWELSNRGILSDKELWLKKLTDDQDVYWLAYKVANKTVNK